MRRTTGFTSPCEQQGGSGLVAYARSVRNLTFSAEPPALDSSRINTATLFGIGLLWAAQGSAQPTCSIDLGPDHTICQGQNVQLQAPAGYAGYLWSTGATTQNITVSTAGNYWGEVSYNSGNLVANGNFSAGNTGFSSDWTYNSNLNGEGTYYVDNVSTPHHAQFSGTGTGLFMMVNAGWGSYGVLNFHNVWCQSITVCPGQTYNLSYRARTLSNATPARLQWYVDGVAVGPEVNLPAFSSGWQTFNQVWISGAGQTSANCCLQVMSGDGVGNDFGLDDISVSGTIRLRDYVQVNVTALPVVNLGPDQTLCVGTPLPLNAAVPGGTYLWQDGATTSTYNVSTAGNYSVTVTANGCSNSDAIAVTYNPYPVVDLGPDATLCIGQQLVLNAAQPGGSYSWQNNSTAATFNVMAPGVYDVDVTVGGCTTNDAITVTYNPLPVVNLGADQTICEGAQVLLNANLPGGSYVWQDGSTNATFIATTTGTYSVDVTVNGCSEGDAMNVTVNPNPTVDLGADVALCDGDQIILNATTAGATYSWQDNSSAPTFTATTTGTYDVDVTVNGCTTNDAINVTFNPVPSVDLGLDATICEGDPLQLDATVAGASYIWQDGSTNATFDVTVTGTYDVDVTLGTCSASDAVNVTVNPNPIVDLGADAALCDGDQIILNATTAGATYSWQDNGSAPTFTATTTGTYDVDVTVNGCTTNDAINVIFNPMPSVDLGLDATICDGDPLQLDASVDGAMYIWQDGSTSATFDVTTTGTYEVDVTLGTCSSSDAINVIVNPNPTVDLGADVTLCDGDQIILNATTAGATYSWQDNSSAPTFTATATGTYEVDVTVNGCTTNDTVNVTFNPMPVVDLGVDATICEGDPLQLDATVAGASYIWQDGSTNATFDVTVTGTYDVDVTLGTCSASDAVNVTVNPNPIVDLGADAALCDGDQIILNATTAGATYSWQDNGSAPTFTATTTGTYDVDVTVNGCTTNDAVNVTFNPMPTVDLGLDATICEGDPFQLDASSPGASYLWQDGSTSATFDVVVSGSYSVDVSLGSCSVSDQIDVTVNPVPIVNLGADASLCAGDQLVIDATMPGAAYLWQDNSTGPTFTADATGVYDVDVTVNGCTSNDAIQVTVYPMPAVDLGADITVCQGTPVQLDATVAGATYIWQNGSTNATFDVNTTGTYSVTVYLGSCSASDAIDVTVHQNPMVNLGADAALCDGDQLVLNATTPGATYSWQDNSSAPTFIATTTGTYDVDVTVNGCTTNDAINVAFNPMPTVDLGLDATICEGDPLQLDATSPGASYLWQDGSTNATLDVTVTGTYSVGVSLGSCSATDAIDVTVNPSPDVDLGPDMALCDGDQLVLNATTAGATYNWPDNSSAPTFAVTTDGIYDVDVTVNGCTTNDAITVTFNPVPTMDLGADVAICQGDPLQLDATAPGATYLWQDGSTNATFAVINTGTYDVEVSLGSCTVSDAVTVTVNAAPAFDLGEDLAVCPGEEVTFNASAPGATYMWQDNSTAATFTTDQPGVYSVTVTANGCSSADQITLSNVDLQSVDLGLDATICDGAVLTLDATLPGSTYLWSTGATTATINVTEAGTVGVEVFQSGCSVTDQIDVAVLPSPVVDLGNDTTLCDQATIPLDAFNPGASYSWSTGSTASSIDVSSPALYSVTVDLNGCTTSDDIDIAYVGALALNIGNDTTLCPGATFSLHASLPGGTTVWSTNVVAPTITVDEPDIYWATITVSGCAVSDSITVSEVPLPDLDLGGDAAVCDGNSVAFDITVPGAAYLWEDGTTEPTRTIDEAGEHWARITLTGCMTADTFDLAIIPLPVVDLGPDTGLCDQSMLVLDATTPSATYHWSDDSEQPTLTVGAGDWNVQVTVNGCSSSDAIHVAALPTPVFELPHDTTLCNGSVWMIDAAQPGASYLWQDGSTASGFLVDQAGSYSATVSIATCSVQDAVQVSYFDGSLVDLGPDTVLCPGEQVTLTLDLPGVELIWPDQSTGTNYVVTSGGTYTVTANANGCETTDQILVSYVPLSQPDLGPDRTLCEGDSLTLAVQPGAASVVWSTGSENDSILSTATGDIAVTLMLDGCVSTDVVHVTFLPVVDDIDLGPDATICLGDELMLDATVQLANYAWNTGDDDARIQVTAPGVYHVVLSGPCINASDTIVIGEGNCAPFIYVPNGFTPNGDGINELFAPVTSGNLRSYSFLIFDRWGEAIFNSDEPGEPWDGQLNGTPVQDGVYVWVLIYKSLTDHGVKQERMTGSVTLLR